MRFLGIDIPDNKRIQIALTYIYGIGPFLSSYLLKETGINPDLKAKDLSVEELNILKKTIEKLTIKIEGDLREEKRRNINRLIAINSYRGLRHQRRLPVRGQRTKTNSRTIRGNVRKSVGSGRRKVADKT